MSWRFLGTTGSETATLGPYYDDGDLGIFRYAEVTASVRTDAESRSPATIAAPNRRPSAKVFCFQSERAKRNLPVRLAPV